MGLTPRKYTYEKGPQKNWKKIIWTTTITIILLAIIACIGISIYVGHSMTHPEKKPIDELPSKYGIAYDDVTFLSKDGGTKLAGWVLQPEVPAKMTVIFGHGYKGNRFEDHIPFFTIAEELLDHGYRILMFDFRYAGESEGDMTTIGVKEQLDMLGAIDYMEENYDDPIGLLGMSMGASTSLLAAAQSDVTAVVADSPFSDLESYLKENLPVWSNLPSFPFTPLILNITPLLTDLDPKEASPISVLDDIAPRPVLFIHNKGDASIPYTESELLASKHPEHFSTWFPDGEGHVTAFKQNRKAYIEKVDEFFTNALNEQ